MTPDRALVLRVTAVTHPEGLPPAYQVTGAVPGKCATDALVEAVRSFERQSPVIQAELAALLARPSTTDFYDSPGGHFRIHYSTNGGNAIPLTDADFSGVPDYAENLGLYADSSWHREVDTYGFLPPPSDGTVGGGSGLYDIYCQSIPYYGYTQPESPGPAAWNDYTSFIVVHNNFQGFPPNTDPEGNVAGAAKVTVAHEFQHACQFAYDVNESSWWMEATATWMEDEVFDLVNDNYNYLPSFFSTPQTSLYFANGGHEYGAFIWPRFLSERYGTDIIRQVWQDCITNSVLPAIDAQLVGMGASRDLAFAEFTAWDWITGTRDDASHYEEGSHYPLAPAMRTHSTYPVGAQTSTQVPAALASNYISFQTGSIPAGRPLAVFFDGDDTQSWAAYLVGKGPGGTDDLIPLALDVKWQGSASLPFASTYTNVALVPAAIGVTGSGNYTYSACVGPLPPSPVAPAMGDTASVPAHIEWEAVAGALGYRVQVDLDSSFSAPYVDSSLTAVALDVIGLDQGARYFWRVAMTDACATSAFSAPQSFTAACTVALTGDVNVDGMRTAGDIIALVNYIFKGGTPPLPVAEAGDVNCSGSVTSADIIYLVAYVFKGGPAPCDVCTIL